MSKLLANQIANYGDDAPIEIKEGLNIPAGKPIQAGGVAGSAGQVLSSTGATIQWVTPFDGDYNSLTNTPTIPAAQVPSDWNASGGAARILNKPVVPQQPSVTTTAVGSAALSYNSTNGEFTFTPPDLTNSTNWDTAYGWGNHASAGYLTAEADTLDSVCERGKQILSGGGFGVLTDVRIVGTDGIKASYFGCGALGGASQGDLTITHNDNSHASTIRHGNTLNDLEIKSVNKIEFYAGASETLRLEVTNTGVNVNGNVNLGSGDLLTTGKLYYSNNFADLTALNAVNASTYHGMFAHVHAEGHGYFAHAGGWIQMLDTGSSLGELADVDLSTAPTTGQVLKWDGSNWVPAADGGGGGGGGISLTDISVTTASAGSPSLSYNNVSGVFTYTPPDLTPYAQTANLNVANWDAAYGWGNHGAQGYLTAETDTLATVTGRGGATSTALTLSGTISIDNTIQVADNIVANFGAQQDGRISYVSSTNRFYVRVPGGSGDLILGAGPAVRITNENGLTDRAVFTATTATINADLAVAGANNAIDCAEGSITAGRTFSGFFTGTIIGNSGQLSIVRRTNGNLIDATYSFGGNIKTFSVDQNANINTSGTLTAGGLTAGGLTYPITNGTNGQVLTSDGAGNVTWQNATSGGASVTISDTPPAASPGDLWWESDSGRLKIRYQDTDSTQWVDVAPPLAPSLSSNAPATASSTGSAGDIRYDSGYVYICVATDTWKRAALATW